jgi:integrase
MPGKRPRIVGAAVLGAGDRASRLLARATFLLAKGVPDRIIMEVLGHAEIGVTMNTYAHVLPVLCQGAADAIDELFGA